jgi:hypothetical protein
VPNTQYTFLEHFFTTGGTNKKGPLFTRLVKRATPEEERPFKERPPEEERPMGALRVVGKRAPLRGAHISVHFRGGTGFFLPDTVFTSFVTTNAVTHVVQRFVFETTYFSSTPYHS